MEHVTLRFEDIRMVKDAFQISNEEGGHGKPVTHRTDREKEGQGKAMYDIFNGPEQVDGRTVWMWLWPVFNFQKLRNYHLKYPFSKFIKIFWNQIPLVKLILLLFFFYSFLLNWFFDLFFFSLSFSFSLFFLHVGFMPPSLILFFWCNKA